MRDTAPPVMQHLRTTVEGVDRTEHVIRELYGAVRFQKARGDVATRFEHRFDGDGELSTNRVLLDGTVHAVSDDMGFVTVSRALAGGTTYTTRGRTTGAARPMLVPPATRVSAVMVDCDIRVVNLDARVFDEAIARRWGVEPGFRAHPEIEAPTPALVDHWNRFANHLIADLASADAALANPLIRATALEMCANTIVAVFYGDPETARPDDDGAMPSSVRRALEFIDEHADRPITVGDIAEAARVTTRGLQSALQRHLGVSPLQRLRSVRLARAREALLVADPGSETVDAIARRWGFANAGRFAGEYRRAFGEPPSATLRR